MQDKILDNVEKICSESLKVITPIQSLLLVQRKIRGRGFQSFDVQDIKDEMGRIQYILNNINNALLQTDNLINQFEK